MSSSVRKRRRLETWKIRRTKGLQKSALLTFRRSFVHEGWLVPVFRWTKHETFRNYDITGFPRILVLYTIRLELLLPIIYPIQK
jgi:hypothetical protein